MNHFEKQIDSEQLYDGRIIRVCKDTVELENGEHALREIVHHSGGVAVMAITEDKKVYMVRQFRYPYGRMLLEIPAGKLNYGEDPLTCGKRELEEETAMIADCYTDLGKLYPTVAYVDEVIHCYMATGLHRGTQHLDDDEFLDVELIDLQTLVDMVLANEICDSKTQVMVLKAHALLNE